MSLMHWDESFSVGIEKFDEEHQQLVAMLNELFEAVQAGRGREGLGEIMDRLIDYTKFHFANEEHYLLKHGYPDLEAHKEEHRILTRQVEEMLRKYRSGATAMLSMEVLHFLKSWLTNHIKGTDKQYGGYLQERGLK